MWTTSVARTCAASSAGFPRCAWNRATSTTLDSSRAAGYSATSTACWASTCTSPPASRQPLRSRRHGTTSVDGVLLVYHRPIAPWIRDASTVMEHVGAFARHSRHRVWEVNTDLGFPPGLAGLRFGAVIIHYCVFGMGGYRLSDDWLEYLDASDAYKVAFFQDECTRCQRRFRFLDEHSIDCVFTCLE